MARGHAHGPAPDGIGCDLDCGRNERTRIAERHQPPVFPVAQVRSGSTVVKGNGRHAARQQFAWDTAECGAIVGIADGGAMTAA